MRYFAMSALGDQAVSVKLGERPSPETSQSIRALLSYLEEQPIPGMIEAVPGLTTVAVYYDPMQVFAAATSDRPECNRESAAPIEAEQSAVRQPTAVKTGIGFGLDIHPATLVCEYLQKVIERLDHRIVLPSRIVEIPVCYEEPYGLDLNEVAEMNGLTAEEVIALHCQADYTVTMLGFSPGFPYLEGMNPRISAPRKASPRLQIAAGSVGIAGRQTGVYPIATPGGWNVIGRTPLRLFLPEQQPPTLLRVGDVVRFRPITVKEYREMEGSA